MSDTNNIIPDEVTTETAPPEPVSKEYEKLGGDKEDNGIRKEEVAPEEEKQGPSAAAAPNDSLPVLSENEKYEPSSSITKTVEQDKQQVLPMNVPESSQSSDEATSEPSQPLRLSNSSEVGSVVDDGTLGITLESNLSREQGETNDEVDAGDEPVAVSPPPTAAAETKDEGVEDLQQQQEVQPGEKEEEKQVKEEAKSAAAVEDAALIKEETPAAARDSALPSPVAENNEKEADSTTQQAQSTSSPPPSKAPEQGSEPIIDQQQNEQPILIDTDDLVAIQIQEETAPQQLVGTATTDEIINSGGFAPSIGVALTGETTPATPAFVNDGFALWEKNRREWLNRNRAVDAADGNDASSEGSGSCSQPSTNNESNALFVATTRGRGRGRSRPPAQPTTATPLDVDDIIDIIFASPRQIREEGGPRAFPKPVTLPQMIDILVDLWEAEGLDV